MLAHVRWPHVVAGLSVAAMGTSVGYLAFAPPSPVAADAFTEDARRHVFDTNAPVYDDSVGLHERLSGITGMRESLLAQVRGRVLEVGAGTARNLAFYRRSPDVDLVLVDFSVEMLRQAEAKLRGSSERPASVTLAAADVHSLPWKEREFDFVVDTFGLCSYKDPVQALREMSRVTKQGGRILLLEQGRSSYGWLSDFLDRHAPGHVCRHGSAWNQDVDALVQEAGLCVLSRSTRHFDTTYMLVCAPPAATGSGSSQEGSCRGSALK